MVKASLKYIRLGSGRAQSQTVGNKAALLDKAAHAGIRVPRGVIVLDAAWDMAALVGALNIYEEHITSPNPQRLSNFLGLPRFRRPVAVRSAFSTEDTEIESMAGYFDTVLNVEAADPEALSNAICTVLDSAKQQTGRFRWDLLIMQMVQAEHAGVAFTERDYEDDLVNYTPGTAHRLVSGEVPGDSLVLPKLRPAEPGLPGENLADWQKRLQELLRDIRRWMGDADWDIEWADDGQHCYLIQLRPVTRSPRRDEVFTLANHKEILPELPSVFMTSLIESCASELFAYYRRFDSSLPENRPFIEVFAGRPYINLSLLMEMMRIFGLPSRLVTDNIGGEDGGNHNFNPRRMIDKTLRLTLPRFALAQLLSVQHAHRSTVEMLNRTEHPGTTFHELIDTLRWLYIKLVTEMFSLTAAIGPMMSLLRRFGTLEEHSIRHRTISTQMYTDLNTLRRLAAQRPETLTALRRGEIPDDHEFRRAWQHYLAKYGQRGIYESDIARPRYHEKPAPLLRGIATEPVESPARPRRSLLGVLTLPLWWQAARTTRARERWRHDTMTGFDRVRSALLRLAEREVQRGALPDVDSLWLLTVEEVSQLDGGWTPTADFWAERRAEIEHLKTYRLPDLLHRSDDLELFREGADSGPDDNRLTGISLTRGEITGRAWVLEEPEVDLPADFTPENTILVARSVDAGWIPTFAQVAGVVVETGGDLSHGSIILREIGLPAVTNVHGALSSIDSGDLLRLRAGVGVVTVESEDIAAEPLPG